MPDSSISRRSFLKRAAAAGALASTVYVAPRVSTILAKPAYAASTGVNGPLCIVVPNDRTNQDGQEEQIRPYFGGAGRRQTVFSHTQLGFGVPVRITSVTHRPDQSLARAFDLTLADVRISLSTTQKEPQGLSNTFADNVGPDEVVIHNGPLNLTSAFTGPGPKDFDVEIPVANPFVFDPTAGNLLMDVTVNTGIVVSPLLTLDAQITQTLGVLSTVGTDDPTASSALGEAESLITRFCGMPVRR